MHLVWSTTARDDLIHLRGYIEAHNPVAARSVAARIIGTVRLLKDHPHAGRPGRVHRTRELVVPHTPFMVVYRVKANEILILTVLHTARSWPENF